MAYGCMNMWLSSGELAKHEKVQGRGGVGEDSFMPPDGSKDDGPQQAAQHQPAQQEVDSGAAITQVFQPPEGAQAAPAPARNWQGSAGGAVPGGAVPNGTENTIGFGDANDQVSPESATPKRRNRRLIVTAIGVSYLVLAAGTAAAVVAVASPAPVDVAALSSASAGPGGGGSAPSTTASAASPSASPSPSPSPSPSSTVVGSVKDGVHSGDLRYFLLPPPDGPSSVHGDPDGTAESLSDVVTEYGGSSDVKSYLHQMGFKGGAQRTYQDSTLGANVSIELLQFDSSGDADTWLQGFQLGGDGWTSFSVSGESGASAREKSGDGIDRLVGVYAEGDTFYEINVLGTQTLPHGDLSDLMNAEHGRLAHG